MSGAALTFLLLLLLLLLFLGSLPESLSHATRHQQNQASCSKTCVAVECNSLGIRYGKYCGVGWTGCPDEEPCDELDDCCRKHDICVEKKGVTNINCHEKFKKCMKKVEKSGRRGFSDKCPYEVAIPLMTQGMDMAILFSQLGTQGSM